MFTKNYYGGNFYSRAKARYKSRGVKLTQRRSGSKPTKLRSAYTKPSSMLGKRSRSSSIATSNVASPILYRPDRLNYGSGSYGLSQPYVHRPDGSYYKSNVGTYGRKSASDRASYVLEKVAEDLVGEGADWLSKRRFAAKKKKSLKGKRLYG